MFIRLLGIGFAAALLAVAAPATAFADTPAGFAVDPGFLDVAPSNDCFASFDMSQAILLVEAETDCDAILAQATGLCLTPALVAPMASVVGVLDPKQGIICTSIAPSPPG